MHRRRVYQGQVIDGKIAHCPGNGTDISRILRSYKNDPQVHEIHTCVLVTAFKCQDRENDWSLFSFGDSQPRENVSQLLLMFTRCSGLSIPHVPLLSEPANNGFSLHERPTTTGMVTFPIHNVRFEQFFEVPVKGIGTTLFTHLLQQFAQTIEPFAVKLNLDA
jgi:hypothetical protein